MNAHTKLTATEPLPTIEIDPEAELLRLGDQFKDALAADKKSGDAVGEALASDPNYDDLQRADRDAWGHIVDLSEHIMKLPTTTLAGLAVKALVVNSEGHALVAGADMNPNAVNAFRLAGAVLVAAGVTHEPVPAIDPEEYVDTLNCHGMTVLALDEGEGQQGVYEFFGEGANSSHPAVMRAMYRARSVPGWTAMLFDYLQSDRYKANVAAAASVAAREAATSRPPDGELRQLWKEYQDNVRAYEEADAARAPVRAAFDAEMPPCPEGVLPGHHWEAQRPLWEKYGLDALCDACEAADMKVRASISAIRAAKAEGPEGIAVKLSAVAPPSDGNEAPEDYQETIASVMPDLMANRGEAGLVQAFLVPDQHAEAA